MRGAVPRGISARTIGAGTTLAELEASTEIPKALREACRLAASPQLRNMGTIGGNLLQATRCWYWRLRFPCRLHGGDTCHARDGQHREHAFFGNDFCASAHPSDPAAALLAIGARIRTDRRELELAELYRLPTEDDRSTTTLASDELILELELPEVEASTYLKAMDRQRWAFALVGVAAARVGGETRIALAGAAPIPWLLSSRDELDARHAARRHGVQGRDRPHARGTSDGGALDTIRGRHATRARPLPARPRPRALALGVRRRRRGVVRLIVLRADDGCETVERRRRRPTAARRRRPARWKRERRTSSSSRPTAATSRSGSTPSWRRRRPRRSSPWQRTASTTTRRSIALSLDS